MKVETLEVTTRNAMKSIEELDRGLAFLNNEVEELKKLETDCTALRQEVLYMGVYQRRENLRFYGIEEDPEGAESFLRQRRRARRPILGELSLINCLSTADYFRPRCATKTMLTFFFTLPVFVI